jgi:hypothetical protein
MTMEKNVDRFVRIVDSFTDGRTSLGFSVENDMGGFDAFGANDEPLGTFDSRIAARRAIIDAANNGDAS